MYMTIPVEVNTMTIYVVICDDTQTKLFLWSFFVIAAVRHPIHRTVNTNSNRSVFRSNLK